MTAPPERDQGGRPGDRTWHVKFLGDPGYGYEEWDDTPAAMVEVVQAPDAGTAARRVMSKWRREEALNVREEGFYGDDTLVAVQEAVSPPPIIKFRRVAGRMRLERD